MLDILKGGFLFISMVIKILLVMLLILALLALGGVLAFGLFYFYVAK